MKRHSPTGGGVEYGEAGSPKTTRDVTNVPCLSKTPKLCGCIKVPRRYRSRATWFLATPLSTTATTGISSTEIWANGGTAERAITERLDRAEIGESRGGCTA